MVGEKTTRIDARLMEIALYEGAEDIYELAQDNSKLKKQLLTLQKENLALKHLILEERQDRAELKKTTAFYKRLIEKLENAMVKEGRMYAKNSQDTR